MIATLLTHLAMLAIVIAGVHYSRMAMAMWFPQRRQEDVLAWLWPILTVIVLGLLQTAAWVMARVRCSAWYDRIGSLLLAAAYLYGLALAWFSWSPLAGVLIKEIKQPPGL
ncbi:MAG: hypothetical protein FJ288_18900 [Planctomycetes bacterium]|nr:hypothetical protein [Planctomycetota bacterium]